MKTLLLLRHAKSSWDDDSLSDHDRPLNKRGRADAPRMGRLLVAENLVPELIISSTATRAKSTAQAVAAAAGYPAEIHYSRELYLADPDTYLEVAAAVDDRYQCLMLVGHNPGLEELVADLSGSEERMTTAALACVRLPISKWREISPSMSIDSLQIWRPKEIS